LDKAQKKLLKQETLSGTEIVDATARLAAMNAQSRWATA
jgi:hypothetical protein